MSSQIQKPVVEDKSSNSRSTANSYSKEWRNLFEKQDLLENLKELSIKGELRSSRFRSICWRIFLNVLSKNSKNWLDELRSQRREYMALKDKVFVNPRLCQKNLQINNPLSLDDDSPWFNYFQDKELKSLINQDVVRTFPNVLFFQDSAIQGSMLDILFIYARVNNKISYKQGMHELLAPIIFVLHSDHQAFSHAKELNSLKHEIQEAMNPDYMEHDAYSMFCKIMETVEPWYINRELTVKQAQMRKLIAEPFNKQAEICPNNTIVSKLIRIQDYLLKHFDPYLHKALAENDIIPQFYGIRWIRLLFGREFPLQDLLVIWDVIFSDGLSLDLVDYIFTAMLIYIRDYLIDRDYASCLNVLMRYPHVGDVHNFIDLALYLRSPKEFNLPNWAKFLKNCNLKSNSISIDERRPEANIENNGRLSIRSGSSILSRIKSLSRKDKHNKTRPNSLCMNNNGFFSASEKIESPDDRYGHRSPMISPSKKSLSASSSNLTSEEDGFLKRTNSSLSICSIDSNITAKSEIISSNNNNKNFSRFFNRRNKDDNIQKVIDRQEAILISRLKDREKLMKYCAQQVELNVNVLKGFSYDQELQEVINELQKVGCLLSGNGVNNNNNNNNNNIKLDENGYESPVAVDTVEKETLSNGNCHSQEMDELNRLNS